MSPLLRSHLRHRRLLVTAIVVALVVLLVTVGLTVFGQGVIRRRTSSQATTRTLVQKVEEQHAADLRLCEVAMNVNARRFLDIVTKLGSLAPPPGSAAEADLNRQAQVILDEGLAPIDCEAFVDTGAIVPAAP
jgi:hypothetical protein